jgi:hypothetical protein
LRASIVWNATAHAQRLVTALVSSSTWISASLYRIREGSGSGLGALRCRHRNAGA